MTADPSPTSARWGPLEVIAVLGLIVGAFAVPVVGPLIGLVCAWVSTSWTLQDKLVATALSFLGVVLPVMGLTALLIFG